MDAKLITLTLTEQDAQTLYELLAMAGNAGGPQVWKAAMPLVDKLMAAVKESQSDAEQV